MQVENPKSIRSVLRLMKSKGYRIFDRPYELNIVGIRNPSIVPNTFDDRILVMFKNDKGAWEGKSYKATTDPGTFWLKNPMNPQGTAVLMQGQYLDSHQIGLHQGRYEALTQKKPVTVLRQYQRDAVLDFMNGKPETGLFGINIHRANATGTTKSIDKYSAGCQVFENAEEFDDFLAKAKKHKDLYGNSFTYTLIDERAYLRMLKRRTVYVLAGLAITAAVWVAYRTYKNKPIIPKL